MAYIPNPADATQPVGTVDAGTADDEFRALKAYIQTLAFGVGSFSGPRQCPLVGVRDANAQANALQTAAGGGLNLDLKCTPDALVLGFANGFNGLGQIDSFAQLTNDVANAVPGIAALSTNYIYATWATTGSVTWGCTIIPPQYDYVFDQTRQSSLHFEGSNGATTTLDVYGGTWTMVNSTIDTSKFKFGTSSINFNGTTAYIENVLMDGPPSFEDSWTAEWWVNWATLPAASSQMMYSSSVSGDFGAFLALNDTAGTKKLQLSLSSNGTSNDIANGTLGTDTTWATATWYHIALVFDAIAGKYFVYKNGLLDITVNSAVRINKTGTAKTRLGASVNGASFLNGNIDEFRLSPCCRYPNGVAFTPAVAAFGLEGDWFDIQVMQMKTPSVASVAAGTNPTFTTSKKLYVGETNTNATITTAIKNYAYQAKYDSGVTTPLPGTSAVVSFNHNIGVKQLNAKPYLVNLVTEGGYQVGTKLLSLETSNATYQTPVQPGTARLTASYSTGPTVAFSGVPQAGGAFISLTAAKWGYGISIAREW